MVKKSEANMPLVPKAGKPDQAGTKQMPKIALDEQVYLAFLPADKAIKASGDLRLFIVNATDYSIHMVASISGKLEGNYDFLFQQSIERADIQFVDKYPIKLLDDQSIYIQGIFFRNKKFYKPIPPLSVELKIRSSRLVREGSFVSNPFFNENALLLPLLKMHVDEKIELLQQKITEVAPKKELSQKLPKPGDIIETDLHINELLDDTRGLSNSDMLKIQLDKFRQTIDEYKNIKGLKLIFIHGVGGGILKQEIVKLLKNNYKKMYYQDASFKEYGYGATMVIV
ncbi:MAG: DUF2027 domain-containing protein [Breznakibacter sp.]